MEQNLLTAMTTARRTAVTAALSGGALLAFLPSSAQAATSEAQAAPTVSAKGAALIDATSGETLFGKDADTARPLASTTKIMTASVVLDSEGVDLDRQVTVKQEYRDYVTENGTSTADLQVGDRLTVEQLLHAALLPSGADAAFALADTFGTGETSAERTKSFVTKMNTKADELGLPNTDFVTFDGTNAGDVSTPSELARLAQHALENDTFRTVVKTKEYKAEAPAANGNTRYYTWYNTNQLLGSYDGVIGIKTGTTTPAGQCLVFAATRGDKTLVGTILNGTDRYTDAAALLDYGFGDDEADTMKLRKLPADAQRD